MTPARLREWREARGLNYQQAAEQTGTHRNSWPRWEKPDGSPPPWLGYVLRAVGDGLPPYR